MRSSPSCRTFPRMAPFRGLALLAVLAFTAPSTSTSVSAITPSEHLQSQIKWIESKGGYYSSKITYLPMIEGDPNSFHSMHISEAVDKDEILMVIPHSCLLNSGGTDNICDTVKKVAREYELGDKSDFFPYVRYCFDPRHEGDLPQTWTPNGKNLLRSIAGVELFADEDYDVAGMEYEEQCGRSHPNPSEAERKAYHSVLRRSWDDVLIPVFDMVNHRNQPYTNVDSNSPHGESSPDVYVVALRDIAAGEQLYLSYNECTDCHYNDEYAYDYVAQYLLRDYGFVEQYPQRWKLFKGELRFQLEEKVPNLPMFNKGVKESGYVGSGSPLKLTWMDEPPTSEKMVELELDPYFYGHLDLLKTLPVETLVKELNLPPHEAYTSMAFHKSLINVLEHLIWYMQDYNDEAYIGGTDKRWVTYGPGDKPLQWVQYFEELEWTYDNDDSEYGEVELHQTTCAQPYRDRHLMRTSKNVWEEHSERFELIGKVNSFYQLMTFWQSREGEYEEKDVCFKIERNWESCQSNRPHYHEPAVHHPASFIPEVKRVMFLGGGDNMILHEVLKYNTLELVVGLELDKGVNQATFVYFETLPHFDDDRVEWWFGDAAISLKLLPRDYLSSFDLIIVDMQNPIVNALNIMEKVSRFAHPQHGIIVRNEDDGFGTNDPYALYNVDHYLGSVPVFCHNPVTMGSNVVDFLTAPQYKHDIANLLEPSVGDPSVGFDNWYNYRKVDRFGVDKEVVESPEETPAAAGVLLVLELEQVTAEKISADHISNALANAGISASETKMSPEGFLTQGMMKFHDTMVFLAEEGYAVARAFPGERYCAFDVMLWNNYEKMYSVERSLVSALDSGVTSSYRIVTGGVFGVTHNGENDKAGEVKSDISPSCNDEQAEAVDVDPAFALPIGQPHANAAMKNILSSLISNESSSPKILVLCGETSEPCEALEVAASFSPTIAIHACPASESIFACESKFRSSIRDIMMKRGNKIDAILIDEASPKRSGQILLRIFGHAEVRGQVLSDTLVAAGVGMGQSSSWPRVLLDRFRTDFFPYNPSFHAEVMFYPPNHDTSKSGKSAGLGVSIFSAGNHKFYSDFVQTVREIAETTGLSSDVRYVKDGSNNYVADFSPTQEFSRGSYDNSAARELRKSQKALGRQSVWQYEAKAPLTEYTPSSIASRLEKVLYLMNTKKVVYEMHKAKIGDGCVIFALWEGGDASVIYDGRSHLDLNLFTLLQDEDVHINFEGHFAKNMPSVALNLGDMQPRGTGRVIVFDTAYDDNNA